MTNPARTTLALVLTVLLYCFPSYDVALVLGEMDDNWNALFLQAREPFTDHTDLYDPESHMSKLSFRFVPALLMGALGIQTIAPALLLQVGLLVLFYGLLVLVLRCYLQDPNEALVFALPICFIISGHVYASDYRGIFDTLALVFLLLAVLWKGKALMVPALLLAYFTDERAIIASSSLVLIILWQAHASTLRSMVNSLFSVSGLLLLGSWLLYALLRHLLGTHVGLKVTSVDTFYYFKENLPNLLYAVLIGMEGLLLVLGAVLWSSWRVGYKWPAFFIALNYAAFFIVSMSVLDINRSFAYALVLQLFLLLAVDRGASVRQKWNLLGWSILLSIPFVDFFPLPLQLYRMVFITQTLLG